MAFFFQQGDPEDLDTLFSLGQESLLVTTSFPEISVPFYRTQMHNALFPFCQCYLFHLHFTPIYQKLPYAAYKIISVGLLVDYRIPEDPHLAYIVRKKVNK